MCLFGVLRRFQHCTGHITTGSWKGRGNQYIEFPRVLYCKLPTNGKQLPAFPHTAMTGIEPQLQRWEARVLPLCHRGPFVLCESSCWHLCKHTNPPLYSYNQKEKNIDFCLQTQGLKKKLFFFFFLQKKNPILKGLLFHSYYRPDGCTVLSNLYGDATMYPYKVEWHWGVHYETINQQHTGIPQPLQ